MADSSLTESVIENAALESYLRNLGVIAERFFFEMGNIVCTGPKVCLRPPMVWG